MVYGATLHYPATDTMEAADYHFASVDGENWVCVNRLPERPEDEEEVRKLIEGEPWDPEKDDGTWPLGYKRVETEQGEMVRPVLFSTDHLKQRPAAPEFYDPIGESNG